MSSFSLSFEELTIALTFMQAGRERVQEEIRAATTSMNGIRESDAFTGITKQGIDLVIANQHIPILKAIEECYRLLENEMRAMIIRAREHMNEGDDNAIIQQFALEEFRGKLNKYHEFKEDFDNEFEMVYNRVADYLDINMPSSDGYNASHHRLNTNVDKALERINSFSFDWSEVVTLKDKLNQEIARLESVVNRPFDSTQRLRVSRITDFRNAMIDRVETREEAMISKVNELFQLWQTMTPREAFMSMSNPPSEEEMTAWYMFVDTFYHSWTPEERQLIGGNQIYGGAWRILVGLGAIAMTKGAAKPFVIASWASGGASIIFGASHIVEGAHNLLLAWEWDIETQAFNPIRDTVFGGNQAVHDSTNFWASMFSMTFMCTGSTLPRHHKPIAFDERVINDISRRTGFTPSQVGDLIRYRGLTDKAILARLNKGQSIHRVLGVSPAFDTAKVNEIARRTGLVSKQVEDILRNIDMNEVEFLARLSRGQNVHQILRVTPPIVTFDSAKISDISQRTGMSSRQIEDMLRYRGLSETTVLEGLQRGQSIHQVFSVTPTQVIGKQTFSSWNQMKNAYRGHWTNWRETNKPKGSPAIDRWFREGGTIMVESLDNGTHIWHYTKRGLTVSYVPKVINGQLQNVVQFPSEYIYRRTNFNGTFRISEGFSGNRATDTTNALRHLRGEYGISRIPFGYTLHHGIGDGVFQLVRKNIHKNFTHYGGHFYYNQ